MEGFDWGCTAGKVALLPLCRHMAPMSQGRKAQEFGQSRVTMALRGEVGGGGGEGWVQVLPGRLLSRSQER